MTDREPTPSMNYAPRGTKFYDCASGWDMMLVGDDDPETNGAGLCRRCHDMVHDHACPDWAEWFTPRQEPEQ